MLKRQLQEEFIATSLESERICSLSVRFSVHVFVFYALILIVCVEL